MGRRYALFLLGGRDFSRFSALGEIRLPVYISAPCQIQLQNLDLGSKPLGVGGSMRRRALISFLVAISVLLHAGLTARHYAVMAAQIALEQDLGLDPSAICRSGEQTNQDQPSAPKPNDELDKRCPLCVGFGPLSAILASTPESTIHLRVYREHHRPHLAETAKTSSAVSLPPSRGPPSRI